MAQAYCLIPELADKLLDAAKREDVVGDIGKLAEMTSQERRDAFAKVIGKEEARQVNASFEQAMISNQKAALNNWVDKTFNAQAMKEGREKAAKESIEKMQTLLTPENMDEFLEDLVAEKLGVRVTAEQGKKIADITTKIEEAKSQFKNLGDHTDNPKAQIEYLIQKAEMEKYLQSLNPSSRLAIATSTIARGNLLLRISSILVNITGNINQGTAEAISRRIENRRFKGMNSGYANQARRFMLDVYKKTGYDLSRTVGLEEQAKVMGEKILHSEGKGIIRKIGRFYEDKVFGLTQGLPDQMAAGLAHVDRADLESTKLARREGLKGNKLKERSLEILKDALKVEPETPEGMAVRNEAIADAAYSTLQHKSLFAEKALELREVFNYKDLKFGDMQIPFVKTAANAISVAVYERTGVAIPVRAATSMINAVKLIQGEQSFIELALKRRPDMAPKEAIQSAFRGYSKTVIRGGLGISSAYLLANAIPAENFVGEYPVDQRERELMEAGNISPNSIKVGGHWISTDYLSGLAAPFIGMMYAKKYGTDLGSTVNAYLTGAGRQLGAIPGLTEVRDMIEGVSKIGKEGEMNLLDTFSHYALSFGVTRSIPGLATQLNSAFDKKRDTKQNKFGNFDDIAAQLPWFRQQLPENKNIFGEDIDGEGWSTLLFGSRVKTAEDTPVINELIRLKDTGNIPSLTDVTKKSVRAQRLKEQIGDQEYEHFLYDYGQAFKEGIIELIEEDDYKAALDEEKAEMINSLKKEVFTEYLDEYGYEDPNE
jgi:hypothetical protein